MCVSVWLTKEKFACRFRTIGVNVSPFGVSGSSSHSSGSAPSPLNAHSSRKLPKFGRFRIAFCQLTMFWKSGPSSR